MNALELEKDYEPFLLPGRCWKVLFIGESVDDCGGGYSDSIAEICEELHVTTGPNRLSVLQQTPDSKDLDHDYSKSFVLKPVEKDEFSEINENLLIFLGKLMGCALRQGSPLSIRLHGSMWKAIKGMPLSLSDIFDTDSAFENQITFALQSEDFQKKSISLLSGQEIEISANSRAEFLQKALLIRSGEFSRSIALVREGLGQVVPINYINLFTPKELSDLVCGKGRLEIRKNFIFKRKNQL